MTVLESLSPKARVAIVRLRSLGDSVLSTPAIHLLKRARPDLRIAVVSEPRFAPVYEGNPDIEEVLKPGVRTLRAFGPDLCLNLHGGSTSAKLTLLSSARFRAGFEHFRFSEVYNVRIPRAQAILGVERTVHTAEHAASAVFHLGVPVQEIPRARLFAPVRPHGPYAVIHPVASHPSKTWPAAFFTAVAQYVNRELGLQPVFIAGPGEDVAQFQVWPVLAGASLNEVKALLQSAVLFVGNDSGPAHMAAAFGLPVVVLFGPSDEVVWAPWQTESVVLKADGPIHTIEPQKVMRALDRLRVHA
jgi:ADP-heptose:LPS heptosyltransferase